MSNLNESLFLIRVETKPCEFIKPKSTNETDTPITNRLGEQLNMQIANYESNIQQSSSMKRRFSRFCSTI